MSLRTKLFLSYAAVILLALTLAGAASIAIRWRERQRAAVDRLIVGAAQISLDLVRLRLQRVPSDQIAALIRDEAREQHVRMLLVDRDGNVILDSGDTLVGKRLDIPSDDGQAGPSGYVSWSARNEHDLLYLALSPQRPRPRGGGLDAAALAPSGERIVLAVPRETVANAWRGVLPGLAWAGLIALGLSAVVAVLLARSIAHPLLALTRASEEMARGNYDQEIVVHRKDEVGRLASAFNAMAQQVGRSHVQMRTLIANVSHDLKTPLTSIIGFAQALRDGALEGPEQAAETGAIIHEEAERVQALVDDLLYLSEIEAGQVVLSREPVDLAAVAGRAARRFEPALHERGVSLSVELPAQLTVEGDAAKLERVLDNLLDNARKYTPDGGRVIVRGGVDAGAGRVTVAVFNSGSFIAPEDLPRVFERFFRLDRARGRTRGSGLGLSIARELVELHGGAIAVESDAAGTTFTVTLPLAAGAVSREPAAGEHPVATSGGRLPLLYPPRRR